VYAALSDQSMAGYAAALYIRLSKEDGSAHESESITNQRSLLREFCKKHHIYVHDEYVDDGFSGGNFERPAFKRMIDDIEAKNVNMVITKDMSRFGRDYIQTGYYMECYFPERSIRYISLLDGVDTGLELSANEITPFRAIINDLQAKDASKKIKSAKRDKQRKGLFIGWKPPYGYKSLPENNNVLVVDEIAAETVRNIFNMALSGISCRQIAVALNDKGIPTPARYSGIKQSRKGPYSGLWSSERIAEMLKNRVYTGDMVQRRMEKVNYKSKKSRRLPEDQWVIVENTHEPIVDKKTFERVGRLINGRKNTRLRTYDYLLKGMIYCKECQAPLGVINRPLASGRQSLYFICRTYQRFTKNSACTCHCIKVERVTDVITGRIREICAEFLDKKTASKIYSEVVQEIVDASQKESEIKNLISQVKSITMKMDRLYSDRLNGILEDSDFLRVYSQMKLQRSETKERLERLTALKGEPFKLDKNFEELAEKFLSSSSVGRELLCSLIERIDMSEEKELLVCFRFAPEEIIHLQ